MLRVLMAQFQIEGDGPEKQRATIYVAVDAAGVVKINTVPGEVTIPIRDLIQLGRLLDNLAWGDNT